MKADVGSPEALADLEPQLGDPDSWVQSYDKPLLAEGYIAVVGRFVGVDDRKMTVTAEDTLVA